MPRHHWQAGGEAGRPASSVSRGRCSLPRRVGQELARLGVLPGDRLLVALSGGPDSLALFAALSDRPRLAAAHLDHAARPGSAAEAAEVERLCRAWRVPLVSGRLDPARTAGKARRLRSLEAALREERYRFLERAARRTKADWILTGHQADDQAETVLFRAGRDWRSLAAVPRRRGRILRPLLGVPRREVLAFLTRSGLRPLSDPSNSDPCYARNRIRRMVLPALRGSLHPDLPSLLLRLGSAAAALARWEEEELRRRKAPADLRRGISVPRFLSLPAALRESAAVRALAGALGRSPSRAQVSALLRLSGSPGRDGEQAIQGGFLRRGEGRILFRRKPLPPLLSAPPLRLPLPGRVSLPGAAGVLIARLIAWEEPGAHPTGRQAVLDPDSVALPLTVRTRFPGDRFHPLGMRGSRKLQDLLVDRKVPRGERDRLPLVVDAGGRIVWVGGVQVAEEARLRPGARTALLLSWLEPKRAKRS